MDGTLEPEKGVETVEFLIHGGVLIDCTGADPIEKAGLVLRDGVIEKVGHVSTLPKPGSDTHVIDAEGKTIMPGWINLHTHIINRHLRNAMESKRQELRPRKYSDRFAWAVWNSLIEMLQGTTTFRDAGSELNIDLKRTFNGDNPVFHGPTVVSCGQAVAMSGGHGTYGSLISTPADGPDEVRRAVREQMANGADWIKLMASSGLQRMPDHENPRWSEYTLEELEAGVEEAHKRDRRVFVHAHAVDAIKNSIRAGVDCIDHGMFMDEEAVNMMIERDTSFVPTLSGVYNVYQQRGPDFMDLALTELWPPHCEGVRMAYESGVRIGVGTDGAGDMVQEMKTLNQLGLSKLEVLHAVTRVGAEILDLDREIGTLQEGKHGDVLLLNGNPLDSFDALSQISHVFKKGVFVQDNWVLATLE